MSAKITFEQLKIVMRERSGQPGLPSAVVLPNCDSALAEFIRERGFSPSEAVGPTFRRGFNESRAAHLGALRSQGRPRRYIANRSSLLGHWHRLVRILDHEGAASDGTITPLQQALRDLFTGARKIKPTAAACAIPLATLRRWLAGALPQRGGERYLTRLEALCELQPGALVDLMPYGERPQREEKAADLKAIEYRDRQGRLVKDEYQIKTSDTPEQLRAEHRSLLAYKTSSPEDLPTAPGSVSAQVAAPVGLLRRALAADRDALTKQWCLRRVSDKRLQENSWVSVIGGQWCPTAEITWGWVRSFLGWSMLPREKDGREVPRESLTLGLLTKTDLIEEYLQWRVNRSGGINAGVRTFLMIVRMLCHPKTGFLLTRPDIGKRVGIDESAAWRAHCERTHQWIADTERKVAPHIRHTRNPADPIRQSLDLAMPLENFLKGAKALAASRPNTGGQWEAVWARDMLMFTLLLSNPLRVRNLRTLTYRQDNTGNLRRLPSGEWRIFIPREHFKNIRGAAKDKDYDQAVDESVWPYIERYLKNYRAALGVSTTDLVFVSADAPNQEWDGLDRRIETLTARYVPGCPGVGPHAFRHIVATSIIIKTRGDYLLAADTLHDKPETVRRHYALLLASVGDRGRREVLGSIYAQLSQGL